MEKKEIATFLEQKVEFTQRDIFFENIFSLYFRNIFTSPDHLNKLLKYFNYYEPIWRQPVNVYFSILFHDIAESPDVSAELAETYIMKYLARNNSAYAELNISKIKATISLFYLNKTAPWQITEKDIDHDQKLLLDIDRATFLLDRDEMVIQEVKFKNRVLMTHPAVSEEDYLRGRLAFLEKVMSANNIFYSRYFQREHFVSALQNLWYLIAALRGNLMIQKSRR
jgi:predicted metal-dependent HD superfamily phosphohydrolase